MASRNPLSGLLQKWKKQRPQAMYRCDVCFSEIFVSIKQEPTLYMNMIKHESTCLCSCSHVTILGVVA